MNENTGSDTPDVYGALWIGALMLASGSIKDPFPAELGVERDGDAPR